MDESVALIQWFSCEIHNVLFLPLSAWQCDRKEIVYGADNSIDVSVKDEPFTTSGFSFTDAFEMDVTSPDDEFELMELSFVPNGIVKVEIIVNDTIIFESVSCTAIAA